MIPLARQQPTAGAQAMRAPRSSRAYLAIITASFVCGALLLAATAQTSATGSLAVLVVVVALTPLVIQWGRGDIDWLEIVHPIMWQYAAYLAFRAFYLLTVGVPDDGRPDFSDTMNVALVLGLLGMLAFLAGYYLPCGREACGRIGSWFTEVSPIRAQRAVYVLFVIGLGCKAWTAAQGTYLRFLAWEHETQSATVMIVDFLGFTLYYAVALGTATALTVGSTPIFRRLVWFFLVPMAFVLAALGGSKTDLVWLIVGWLFAWNYRVRFVSLRAMALALGIIALIVFPVITAYRGAVAEGNSPSAADLLRNTVQGIGNTPDGYWDSTLTMLADRVAGLDSVALLVKYTPEVEQFQLGRTLVIAPIIAFVPTFVWPEKYAFLETMVSGARVARLYFGWEENISGVPITGVGELYLNFGWSGVVIGMFVIGMWCRFVYRTFLATGKGPLALLIYLFVYLHIAQIDGWFGYYYGVLPKHLAATLAIAWLSGAIRPPHSAALRGPARPLVCSPATRL